MVHSSPVYGLSSAEAQELRDLREVVKHPFAWHNMKAIPAKKNATIPVQQPPTSPIMGSPPGEKTMSNSTQDFGELNLIHSIARHHYRAEEMFSPLYFYEHFCLS